MTRLELDGIYHELYFWKSFVQTPRFIDGWVGRVKTPELNNKVAKFIKANTKPTSRVLDVGSGAVSILNGLLPESAVVAVDPLGSLYSLIFDYVKYGLIPPISVPVEDLDLGVKFDVVHMSNSLDHCQDPLRAIEHLRNHVAPGGFLIIQGFENEATHEKFNGFHQWDLTVDGNALKCSSKFEELILGAGTFCDRSITSNGRDWFIWIDGAN